jgi:hypothetical protein
MVEFWLVRCTGKINSMVQCGQCGQAFSRPFSLRRHVQRMQRRGDSLHGGARQRYVQAKPRIRAGIARQEPETGQRAIVRVPRQTPTPSPIAAEETAIRQRKSLSGTEREWAQYHWLLTMRSKIRQGQASAEELALYAQGEAEYMANAREFRPEKTNGARALATVADAKSMEQAKVTEQRVWFFASPF